MPPLKSFVALLIISITFLSLSGCDSAPETGKVIGYPAEKVSGHVFFLKEGYEADWKSSKQKVESDVETFATKFNEWEENIDTMKPPEEVLRYVNEADLSAYAESIANIQKNWELKQAQKIQKVKADLERALDEKHKFDTKYQHFLKITEEPREAYVTLKERKEFLDNQLKTLDASARDLLNDFIKSNNIKAREVRKAISYPLIEKRLKSKESCVPKKNSSSFYLFKEANHGVKALCYKVAIKNYGIIKKNTPPKEFEVFNQKLTKIVSQYLDANNERQWNEVEKTRTIPSVRKQYKEARANYLKALKEAYQQTKLGNGFTISQAESHIERSLQASAKKVMPIQTHLKQLESEKMPVAYRNATAKKLRDNFMNKVNVLATFQKQMLAEANKQFIGVVPIDTDGTFRVLSGADSGIMAVKIKPKGFLANIADSRLVVNTLQLKMDSEAVKSSGIFEFDYSKTAHEKTPIRQGVVDEDHSMLMMALLEKYSK